MAMRGQGFIIYEDDFVFRDTDGSSKSKSKSKSSKGMKMMRPKGSKGKGMSKSKGGSLDGIVKRGMMNMNNQELDYRGKHGCR
mgnify:CR=1 FL=1